MPWEETTRMLQRVRFISDLESCLYTMTELCERYGVSRKTGDFKGQFRTGEGRLCYPLTVVDGYSRYLLAVEGLDSVSCEQAWPVFERLFREHGLPAAIRTDNGSPFAASMAVGGLSRLSVRWIKLGIRPERIEPGHPEQNGSHERCRRLSESAGIWLWDRGFG